jgi:hypothetical protein
MTTHVRERLEPLRFARHATDTPGASNDPALTARASTSLMLEEATRLLTDGLDRLADETADQSSRRLRHEAGHARDLLLTIQAQLTGDETTTPTRRR